jgi:hypothetical protein
MVRHVLEGDGHKPKNEAQRLADSAPPAGGAAGSTACFIIAPTTCCLLMSETGTAGSSMQPSEQKAVVSTQSAVVK